MLNNNNTLNHLFWLIFAEESPLLLNQHSIASCPESQSPLADCLLSQKNTKITFNHLFADFLLRQRSHSLASSSASASSANPFHFEERLTLLPSLRLPAGDSSDCGGPSTSSEGASGLASLGTGPPTYVLYPPRQMEAG